jgi:hypothetical protein
MATLDDPEITRRRDALAARIDARLQSIDPKDDVVGFAYAIDGKVRAVRWFASHRVFDLVRPSLVNTAAVDALTSKASRPATAEPAPPVQPSDVVAFVRQIQESPVKEERDTQVANKNEYRESAEGFGSRTLMKSRPGAAASAVPVSSDFLEK